MENNTANQSTGPIATEEAFKLSDTERASLALRLLDSLGDESPEDIEQAWIEEARKRLRQVESGETTPISWEEARKQIFAH